MSRIEEGSKVSILVTAALQDGTILEDDKKYEFVVGEGSILPFIEQQVKNMKVSSSVTFTAHQPFGEKDDSLVSEIPLSSIGLDLKIKPGMHLEIGDEALVVTVKNVFNDKIIVDANHPLAGQSIYYTIKLLKVS